MTPFVGALKIVYFGRILPAFSRRERITAPDPLEAPKSAKSECGRMLVAELLFRRAEPTRWGEGADSEDSLDL